MQLDNTRIRIRERDLPDLLDLSLQVVRAYAVPWLATGLAGALPLALFNYWLLSKNFAAYDILAEPSEYIWWLTVLTVWEMPLAAMLTTLLLGQVMFLEQPAAGRMARDFARSLPQMFWFQVVLRGLLMPWVISWMLPFAVWPHLNEIVLLERNPMFSSRGISTWKRSRALHGGSGGELFARWLTCAVVGALLVAAIWLTIWSLRGVFGTEYAFDAAMYTLWLPVAMWTVAGFFAVVRFLGYLDLRIRREGWEVELLIRAEAARLERQTA